MIIPQSFHFVGQIVQFLCSLQSVFQRTLLALQVHLQAAYKIVSDTTVVLKKFRAAQSQHRTITRDEQWFQEDGATPHTSIYR